MKKAKRDNFRRSVSTTNINTTEIVGAAINKLLDNPIDRFAEINALGIMSFDDLRFIVCLMDQAYDTYQDFIVHAPWLKSLLTIIPVITPLLQQKQYDELVRLSHFNPRGGPLIFVDDAIRFFEDRGIISCAYASRITTTLLTILSTIQKSQVELPADAFIQVKQALEPWCFYVAKRSLVPTIPFEMVNSSLLSRKTEPIPKDIFEYVKRSVTARVFFKVASSGPFYDKKPVSVLVAIQLSDGYSLNLKSWDFWNLIECLDILQSGVTTTSGNIRVYPKSLHEDSLSSYSISFRALEGIKLNVRLADQNMQDLMSIAKDIASDNIIKSLMTKEMALKYGAL